MLNGKNFILKKKLKLTCQLNNFILEHFSREDNKAFHTSISQYFCQFTCKRGGAQLHGASVLGEQQCKFMYRYHQLYQEQKWSAAMSQYVRIRRLTLILSSRSSFIIIIEREYYYTAKQDKKAYIGLVPRAYLHSYNIIIVYAWQ